MANTAKATLAAVVASFVRNIVETLVPYAQHADESAELRHATSAELLACLLMLRTAAGDVGAYLNAVQQSFGVKSAGGRGKKADTGAIGAALVKADVNASAGAVRIMLFRARAVADWLADAANVAKAESEGFTFTQCFNAAKPAKAKADASAKAKADPASMANVGLAPDMSADTLQQIIAKVGVARMLKECGAILAAARATALEAKTIEAVAAKIK